MPTMFCSAIPTFTTRSGYAFMNAPIFAVDVESATMTMMSLPASVRRPIAPTAPSRKSPYSRIFKLPQRLLQLIFVRKLVMPCRYVLHERDAASLDRVCDDHFRLSVLVIQTFY